MEGLAFVIAYGVACFLAGCILGYATRRDEERPKDWH